MRELHGAAILPMPRYTARMGRGRSICDWLAYLRTKDFPELSHLPRDAAIRRLRAAEKTARMDAVDWGCVALTVAFVVTTLVLDMLLLTSMTAILTLPLLYRGHRRTRDRLRVIATFEWLGRTPDACIDCGYDLRGSPGSICPECGFDLAAAAAMDDQSTQ